MNNIETYFSYEAVSGSLSDPEGVLIRITKGDFKDEYVQLINQNGVIVYSRLTPQKHMSLSDQRKFEIKITKIFNDILDIECEAA